MGDRGGIVVAGAGVRRNAGLLTAAGDWARGRNGWVRLPLLLWFAWILRQHLGNRSYESLFGGLNLGIHELGHLVFAPLGPFMGIAGGTLLQLAAPLIAAGLFLRQRDYFAITVALCWLATSLFSVARYAGDARARVLPLVSPTSGDPIHDWAYMLGRAGWLQHDAAIAAVLRLAADSAMLAGLGGGAWLVWRMIRSGRPQV